MGAITSKQVSETQKESPFEGELPVPPPNVTPKNTKILPFDPRSPSENVNRTPITVSDGSDKGTPNIKTLKALQIDPRSPTVELTRTPLLVEETNERKKYQPLKPSKLTEINFLPNALLASKDPRSPSDKVPRTPLEEDRDPKGLLHSKETCSESATNHSEPDPIINLTPKLQASTDKDRRPLTDLQNRASNQPRTQLQSLQFRNVEEEFAKSEKMILNKLEVEDKELKTSTEFVETI